jgi:thiamine-phosphate pyrophosphorylase
MLVTDAGRARWPLGELVMAAVAGGVDAVYLRDVDLPLAELGELVRDLQEGIDEATVLLINGEPDAAALGTGLHLRQRDMDPGLARARLGPAALIGRSVHSVEEAAAAHGADYVLAGHVYPTPSKPGRTPLGLAGLAEIVAAAPCPVIAIGGITAERVAEVIRTGAAGVAVIGAIAAAADPRAAAATLRRALDDALSQVDSRAE